MSIRDYRYEDRGPTSSALYNDRIRETIDSYLELAGTISENSDSVKALGYIVTGETNAQSAMITALQGSYEALALGANPLTYGLFVDHVHKNESSIPAIASSSSEALSDPAILEIDSGTMVLPFTSRLSKLHYHIDSGEQIEPEAAVSWTYSGDSDPVSHNSSLFAIDGNNDTVFFITEDASSYADRTLTFYVKVPGLVVPQTGLTNDLSAYGMLSNYIEVDPFPSFGATLNQVSYTTDGGYVGDDNAQWDDLYVYSPDTTADNRFPAPDGTYNLQYNCGLRRYYFGERNITGVRVVLTVPGSSHLSIDGSESYIVGIRNIDVGRASFGDTGTLVYDVSFANPVKKINTLVARVANRGRSTDGTDGIGTDEPEVKLYYDNGTSWAELVTGVLAASGHEFTSARVEVKVSKSTNGCTPVVTGLQIEYTEA